MALLQLPRKLHPDFSGLNRKPTGNIEIDWSNPLTKGLLYLFVWQDGKPYDLVSKQFVDLSTESTSIEHDTQGAYVVHAGRSQASTFSPWADIGSSNLTVFSKFRQPTTSRETLFCSRQANNVSQIEIRLNAASTGAALAGSICFFAKDQIGGGTAAASAITGDWQTATCKKVSGNHFIFVDGKQAATAIVANDDLTGAPNFVFGGLPGTTTIEYNGDRSLDAGWSRDLSDREIASLDADLYQILKPATPVFYYTAGEPPAGVTGSINVTLEDASSTASAVVTNRGSISETLEDASSTGSGSVINSGSLSETLENATSTASGTITVTGSISETLADAVSAASGSIVISGSISELLADATSSAAGVLTVSGSIAETLGNANTAASGVVGNVVSGTINAILEDASGSASGVVPYTGTIDATLEDASIGASGSVVLNITGTLNETLAPATMAASGAVTVNVTGTIAAILEDASMSASGNVVIDYETPRHNMILTVENRIMTLTIEDREMIAQ